MSVPLLRAALLAAGTAAVVSCGGASSSEARDAGTKGGSLADGAPADSGRDGLPIPFEASDRACSPGSLASFTPSFKTPIGPYSGACTNQQLEDLLHACFTTTPTPGPCNAWLQAPGNTTCLQCWGWEGPSTSSVWGPFIMATSGGDELLLNVGGCIDLADPSQVKCATAIQYKLECELAACLETCTIPSNGVVTEIEHCYDEADVGGCASYVAGLSVCESADAGMNPAGFCYGATHLQDDLLRYLSLSCGPAPTADGGND